MQLPQGRGIGRLAPFLVVLVPAAIAGAYLDWILWANEDGLMVSLAAVSILLVAGVLGLVGRVLRRRRIRLVGTAVLVLSLGLLAGQAVGPSREPLIQTSGGKMTLHLAAPIDATATGPVHCTNVASATEFAVTGDPNLRLETPDRPFVSVYANVGDRWQVREDSPRKDGVRLEVGLTPQLVTAAGKPLTTTLVAVSSSNLESSFGNDGGSIRFSGLVARDGPDSDAAIDEVSGTVEWTCGPAR